MPCYSLDSVSSNQNRRLTTSVTSGAGLPNRCQSAHQRSLLIVCVNAGDAISMMPLPMLNGSLPERNTTWIGQYGNRGSCHRLRTRCSTSRPRQWDGRRGSPDACYGWGWSFAFHLLAGYVGAWDCCFLTGEGGPRCVLDKHTTSPFIYPSSFCKSPTHFSFLTPHHPQLFCLSFSAPCMVLEPCVVLSRPVVPLCAWMR